MKNEMVKIRLLNDGSYYALKGASFPVEVFAKNEGRGVRVCDSEMIRIGADKDALNSKGRWFAGHEYEPVTPTYNKPLIDAVNYYRGDRPQNNRKNHMIGYGQSYGFTTTNGATSGVDVICTIEEFNQCVEEMKNSDGVIALGQYSSFKQPLTKENSDYSFYGGKPAVKVEYAPCEFEFAWEAVKAFECGEELYWMPVFGDSFNKCGCAADALLSELYRKVETEISSEQAQIDSVVQDIHSAMFEVDDAMAKEIAHMLQERGHLK